MAKDKKQNQKWEFKVKCWNEVLNNKNIRYQEFGVYAYLWMKYHLEWGYANPSRETIFYELGINNRTFDRILKKLISEGHIEIKKGHKSCTTKYYLKSKPVETVETVEEWEVPNYYYESESE